MAEWTARERKFYEALKAIASYESPDKLKRTSWENYGCEPEYAVEMAYENVIEEAKLAIKGVRKPTNS